MNRRELITLLGSAVAAWPRVGHAQDVAIPVIGFVSSSQSSLATFGPLKAAFEQGLNEGGFFEGRNVAIEHRWAGGRYDRLPGLLADLLARNVALIVAAGGLVSAQHAKAATGTVPILFIAGFDPVLVGLVKTLSHPGGNATGVSVNTTELAQKRLEFLYRLVPDLTIVGALVNPKSTGGVVPKIEIGRVQAAARQFGLKAVALEAGTDADIDDAFALAVRERVGAITVSADPFFTPRRAQIVALAARYRIPTIYPWREYVEAGGLASYGPTLQWAYHQVGAYACRILRGAKPDDLPVQLPTTFEVAISRSAAQALGLSLPRRLFALSNQYIEEFP